MAFGFVTGDEHVAARLEEYQAEATAARLAGSDTTCLVISGMNDAKSEPASQRMVTALRKQGVDVVYSPVPGGKHFIWAAYYREQAFYEFLLMHRRGEATPAGRPSRREFLPRRWIHSPWRCAARRPSARSKR